MDDVGAKLDVIIKNIGDSEDYLLQKKRKMFEVNEGIRKDRLKLQKLQKISDEIETEIIPARKQVATLEAQLEANQIHQKNLNSTGDELLAKTDKVINALNEERANFSHMTDELVMMAETFQKKVALDNPEILAKRKAILQEKQHLELEETQLSCELKVQEDNDQEIARLEKEKQELEENNKDLRHFIESSEDDCYHQLMMYKIERDNLASSTTEPIQKLNKDLESRKEEREYLKSALIAMKKEHRDLHRKLKSVMSGSLLQDALDSTEDFDSNSGLKELNSTTFEAELSSSETISLVSMSSFFTSKTTTHRSESFSATTVSSSNKKNHGSKVSKKGGSSDAPITLDDNDSNDTDIMVLEESATEEHTWQQSANERFPGTHTYQKNWGDSRLGSHFTQHPPPAKIPRLQDTDFTNYFPPATRNARNTNRRMEMPDPNASMSALRKGRGSGDKGKQGLSIPSTPRTFTRNHPPETPESDYVSSLPLHLLGHFTVRQVEGDIDDDDDNDDEENASRIKSAAVKEISGSRKTPTSLPRGSDPTFYQGVPASSRHSSFPLPSQQKHMSSRDHPTKATSSGWPSQSRSSNTPGNDAAIEDMDLSSFAPDWASMSGTNSGESSSSFYPAPSFSQSDVRGWRTPKPPSSANYIPQHSQASSSRYQQAMKASNSGERSAGKQAANNSAEVTLMTDSSDFDPGCSYVSENLSSWLEPIPTNSQMSQNKRYNFLKSGDSSSRNLGEILPSQNFRESNYRSPLDTNRYNERRQSYGSNKRFNFQNRGRDSRDWGQNGHKSSSNFSHERRYNPHSRNPSNQNRDNSSKFSRQSNSKGGGAPRDNSFQGNRDGWAPPNDTNDNVHGDNREGWAAPDVTSDSIQGRNRGGWAAPDVTNDRGQGNRGGWAAPGVTSDSIQRCNRGGWAPPDDTNNNIQGNSRGGWAAPDVTNDKVQGNRGGWAAPDVTSDSIQGRNRGGWAPPDDTNNVQGNNRGGWAAPDITSDNIQGRNRGGWAPPDDTNNVQGNNRGRWAAPDITSDSIQGRNRGGWAAPDVNNDRVQGNNRGGWAAPDVSNDGGGWASHDFTSDNIQANQNQSSSTKKNTANLPPNLEKQKEPERRIRFSDHDQLLGTPQISSRK